MLAHNPSAFTYYGTQTYLLGEREVAVVDPGPDLPEHLDALERRSAAAGVVAIMCTHTHRDHSPAARPLAERTGAPIVGCAPLALETVGPRADASFDGDYAPDRVLEDGEAIEIDGKPIAAVATPGHTSNHLCFAYGDALVQRRPCDGLVDDRRGAARRRHGRLHGSLDKLRQRDDRIYYPAHGPPVTNPQQYVRHLIGHRMQREKQILRLVGETAARRSPTSSPTPIPGLDPRLVTAAGGSVLAHLAGPRAARPRCKHAWRPMDRRLNKPRGARRSSQWR